jgi:23S rRNA pseudouridine2605 synthase
MRLNRYLASAGLGSRRGCETLVREGRVLVNGKICTDLATQIAPGDFVRVDNRVVKAQTHLSALLFKPRGILCTASDERDRATVFDLLPKNWPRLFHVGRLDKESEGLLILTNDGELSLQLTHPRYKIEKEYEVAIDRTLIPEDRARLIAGLMIEGKKAKAERVEKITAMRWRVVLRQGIKRQIRLMFAALDYQVKQLVRVRIGPLSIGHLQPGEWRLLTEREVTLLRQGGPVS